MRSICQPRLRTASTRQVARPRVPVVQSRNVSAAFFKFGGNKSESQTKDFALPQARHHYEDDDVEQYFNYMGLLANEGTYDRMEALQKSGLEPVDVLLILASQENDTPKVIELLAAGARVDTKNPLDGKTILECATKAETIAVIKQYVDKAAKSVAA